MEADDDIEFGSISIRAPQVIALLDGEHDGVLTALAERMRARYPRGLHGVPPEGLLAALHELASRMLDRYGVSTRQDLLQVLTVAVRRGWSFDLDEQGQWARAILSDPRTPRPTRRVQRLVEEHRARAAIEARNRAIDDALGGRPRRRPGPRRS